MFKTFTFRTPLVNRNAMYDHHYRVKCQKFLVMQLPRALCVRMNKVRTYRQICVCSCWEEDKVFPVGLACHLYVVWGRLGMDSRLV